MKISVLMPALNEAENIGAAMAVTLAAFDRMGIDGEVLVINDGSADATPALVEKASAADRRVRLLNHATPQGIGASFWDGVDNASGDAVVLLPGDNETVPSEIFRYAGLLDHVDVVVPYLFSYETRSPLRRAVSLAYRVIVNVSFLTFFNYTNGTVIYRRSILKALTYRSKGFFFQTDILVRLAKEAGYLFAEVPYHISRRSGGASKAVTPAALGQVMRDYARLLAHHYFAKRTDAVYTEDSQTFKRRGALRDLP